VCVCVCVCVCVACVLIPCYVSGPHLEDLLSYCARRFSPKTICLLMLQVGELQYAHRDAVRRCFAIGVPDADAADAR
jgi:hypothetical protein